MYCTSSCNLDQRDEWDPTTRMVTVASSIASSINSNEEKVQEIFRGSTGVDIDDRKEEEKESVEMFSVKAIQPQKLTLVACTKCGVKT
jgi:hypothetical protein